MLTYFLSRGGVSARVMARADEGGSVRPVPYMGRAQAERSAAKVGGSVARIGSAFYVVLGGAA